MKLKFILIGLMSIAYFSSCSDNEYYDVKGNEGCIYVKELKGSAKYPVSGSILNVPTQSVGDADFKFPVRSTMPVKEDVKVQFVIDNKLVDSYNEEYKTQYMTLDPQYFIVENLNLTITKGDTRSNDFLHIWIPEEKYREIEGGIYMIPIRIDKVTGYLKSTTIKENTEVYILVSIVHSDSNLMPGNSTQGKAVTDCSGWIAEYSAPYKIEDWTYEGITDISVALFDQIQQTCLQPSVDFERGDYLLVDLGKVYSDISSIEIRYGNSSYAHTQFNLYTSTDKLEWTKQGTVNVSSWSAACSFYAPLEARYIKVEGEALQYGGIYLYISDFIIYTK